MITADPSLIIALGWSMRHVHHARKLTALLSNSQVNFKQISDQASGSLSFQFSLVMLHRTACIAVSLYVVAIHSLRAVLQEKAVHLASQNRA